MKGDLIDAARQNKARHMADKKQKKLGTHVVRACFSKKPQKIASLSPKGQLKKNTSRSVVLGQDCVFLAYFFVFSSSSCSCQETPKKLDKKY
jgi:hypothetical protein